MPYCQRVNRNDWLQMPTHADFEHWKQSLLADLPLLVPSVDMGCGLHAETPFASLQTAEIAYKLKAATCPINFAFIHCSMQVAAAKQAQQEAGGPEGGLGEVKGFLMGRLLERRPQLEQELLTFRDHLLAASSSSEDQTLKVTHCSCITQPSCTFVFSFSSSPSSASSSFSLRHALRWHSRPALLALTLPNAKCDFCRDLVVCPNLE